MKKIILMGITVLILISELFIITGCENKMENEGQTESQISSNTQIKDEISIGGISFKFDNDKVFKDFKYKNASVIEPDESQMACYLTYENKKIYDGRFVFRIVMDFQENISFNDVTDAPKEGKYETKDINGIKWKTYTSNADKLIGNVFVTEKNNNLYVINVMKYKDANVDINELSNVFMNGVSIQ